VTPFLVPSGEWAAAFSRGREARLLIVPALFEEANRTRRLAVEVMRRLDKAGIDSILPDFPGCNESLQPLAEQTVESWRTAIAAAATAFAATHVLAIRGGALFVPAVLPGWLFAPANGASQLRQMLRARIVASREAGREERQEDLLALGQTEGLELSGYPLSAAFLREFPSLLPPVSPGLSVIEQAVLGGGALWLRAEPGFERAQADALAAIVAVGIRA
jgi:hypothetical protein